MFLSCRDSTNVHSGGCPDGVIDPRTVLWRHNGLPFVSVLGRIVNLSKSVNLGVTVKEISLPYKRARVERRRSVCVLFFIKLDENVRDPTTVCGLGQKSMTNLIYFLHWSLLLKNLLILIVRIWVYVGYRNWHMVNIQGITRFTTLYVYFVKYLFFNT